MIFITSISVLSLVILFFLNRYRKYIYWSEFTKMYGYIRLCEETQMNYDEKSAFWLLYLKKIRQQKKAFLFLGCPTMEDLPEELKPKAKIFDFASYKEKKTNELNEPKVKPEEQK